MWQKLSGLGRMHVSMELTLSLVSGFHKDPLTMLLILLNKDTGPSTEDPGETLEGGRS